MSFLFSFVVFQPVAPIWPALLKQKERGSCHWTNVSTRSTVWPNVPQNATVKQPSPASTLRHTHSQHLSFCFCFFLWLSSAPTVTYGERPLCDLTGPSCTWRRTRSVGRPQITQKQRRFCGEAAQPYTKKRASFLHRLWFGFDTVKIRDLDFILLHRVNVYHIQTNKQTTKQIPIQISIVQ